MAMNIGITPYAYALLLRAFLTCEWLGDGESLRLLPEKRLFAKVLHKLISSLILRTHRRVSYVNPDYPKTSGDAADG